MHRFKSLLANAKFFLHYGDLTDSTNLIRIIQETQPDEIYNLAAQSHVYVSFDAPEYTANFMAKFKKSPKQKKLLFTQEVHMELQNFMPIG